MKILHIGRSYACTGGIGSYVISLLSLLEQHGHSNAVIYRQQHPRTVDSAQRPAYHIRSELEGESTVSELQQVVRTENPDVVYLHDVYDPQLVAEAARLVPTVGYVHGFYPVCPGLAKYFRRGDVVCRRPYGLGCVPMIYLKRCASARHPASVYRIMRRTAEHLAAYKSPTRIIVASTYMRDLLIQNGFEEDRIIVLPYFVEVEQNNDPYSGSTKQILFSGRLEIEKGVPYLLNALPLLRSQCELIVAGEGTRQQEYAGLARGLGVSDRVRFLGWLDAPRLRACYRACSLLVLPSIYPEPFGKVGIEAMTHARPVVAFDVGGISDWLIDGYNGFLVKPKDVRQLADRIDRLLQDPALSTELGRNGCEYVAQHFSPSQHISRLLAIFESVRKTTYVR